MLITAERTDRNARQVLGQISAHEPGQDVAISVVTLMELAHGAARANTPERQAARLQFLHELMTALPIIPVTASIALRAGQVDGENSAKGVRLALTDLLIGVTALDLGYSVATANLRHFRLIPGLEIVSL